MTMTATDATYSNVTVALSGSYTPPVGLYYANLLLVGFTSATNFSSTASATTLALTSDNPDNIPFDTLAYNTQADLNANVNPGTYLQSAGSTDSANAWGGTEFDYSGSATFDLSAISGQLNAGTGDLVAEFGDFFNSGLVIDETIGTWSLDIVSVPEPGTVSLALFGGALALGFVVRRRRAVAA